MTTVDSVTASESQEPKRESRFLGGVSEARFWAIFSSILLVYFVSDQGHIGSASADTYDRSLVSIAH